MRQIRKSRDFYDTDEKGLSFDEVFGETACSTKETSSVRLMFQPDIPPHVSETIRHFPPVLKCSIKAAVRALCVNPNKEAPPCQGIKGVVEIPCEAISYCVCH